MREERRRSALYIFSLLRWGAWIALICAIVLALEIVTGYTCITGTISNYAFVIFVLVLMAAISLTKPEVPFLIAVFFMPLATMGFPGTAFIRGHLANMEPVHPLIIGTILGCVCRAIKRGEPLIGGGPILLPLFLFLGWSAFSLTWCVDRIVGKWILLDIFFDVMICLAAVNAIRSHATLDRVIKTWVISGVFLTGLGLYYVITGGAARVDVMSGHPNVFSEQFNLIIMLVIAMLYIGGRRFSLGWILGPLLLLMFFVNLRTGSRAGFFSLLAGILFFLLGYHSLKKDRRHISLIFFLILIFLVGAVFLVAFNPLEGFRIGFRGYNPVDFAVEDTFRFRLEMWGVVWDYISSSGQYFQGLGIWSFKLLTKDEYGILNHAHNMYLNVFVDYGLVGLLIFVAIYVVAINRFRAALKAAHDKYYQVLLLAMAAALLAFSIHGIVDFWIEALRVMWLFLGVAMAAANLAIKEGQGQGAKGDEDASVLREDHRPARLSG